jgi:hypothetical protein
VDTDGYWLGNREYNYSHGLYQYKSQIKNSFADYQIQARYLLNGILAPMGVFMQEHNLGINLLLLMTYQTTFTSANNDEDTDTFLFTSTPSNVFDSGVYSAAAGTIDSVCDVAPSTSFDRANAKFTIEYNYAQFANSSACMNVFDPKHLGYDPQWSGDVFEIAIGDPPSLLPPSPPPSFSRH